jgi:hypothetical protein
MHDNQSTFLHGLHQRGWIPGTLGDDTMTPGWSLATNSALPFGSYGGLESGRSATPSNRIGLWVPWRSNPTFRASELAATSWPASAPIRASARRFRTSRPTSSKMSTSIRSSDSRPSPRCSRYPAASCPGRLEARRRNDFPSRDSVPQHAMTRADAGGEPSDPTPVRNDSPWDIYLVHLEGPRVYKCARSGGQNGNPG